MWEHYADNHHGACLVFRRQAFIDRFRDTFQERGGPSFHLWGSVDYTPEGFAGSDARFLDPADFVGPTRYSSAAVSYLEHHPRAFLFLKQADWATEAEYRFAVFAPDAPEIYFNYGDTLAAVLVGERFPEWQFPGAKAECKARDVQLRRLGWRMGRPYPEVTVSASGTPRHRRVP
jgi:hypothetical protein